MAFTGLPLAEITMDDNRQCAEGREIREAHTGLGAMKIGKCFLEGSLAKCVNDLNKVYIFDGIFLPLETHEDNMSKILKY